MGFQTLYGNDMVKYRVAGMLKNRKIGHCYAVTGPTGSGKHTFSELFCAALQCEEADSHPEAAPCLRCSACRKVLNKVHPDVIHVDDSEHKQLQIKQVRAIVADAYIRPNEGNRKIYIFDHAEKLNAADQNALLKMLEEPPAHAVFLLLIPNSGLLLPTIRSRCAEFPMSPLPASVLLPELKSRRPGLEQTRYAVASESGYLGTALEQLDSPEQTANNARFVEPFAKGDAIALLELFTGMEKMNREQLAAQLESWRICLVEAMCARYGGKTPDTLQNALISGRSAKDISAAIDALNDAVNSCTGNVAGAAICAALAVKLS